MLIFKMKEMEDLKKMKAYVDKEKTNQTEKYLNFTTIEEKGIGEKLKVF